MTYSGTVVRCLYDWSEMVERDFGIPAPGVDDLLETDSGQRYLILSARVVRRRSRAHAGTRMAYELLRLDPEHHQAAVDECLREGHRMESLRWYGRRRR